MTYVRSGHARWAADLDEPAPGQTAKKRDISAWWLAAGLVASSATAWRVPGTPVGLGELTLAAWLAWEWSRRLWFERVPRRTRLPADAVALLVTLGLLATAQLAANLFGYLGWLHQRDFTAVLFAAGLGYTVATRTDRAAFSYATLVAFFWVATIFSSLLLAYAVVPRSSGLAPVVFNPVFGTRFLGLATNPNQFALLALTLPVGVAFMWQAHTGARRALVLALGCCGLMGGLATQSDALLLTWVLLSAVALIFAAYCRRTATPFRNDVAVVLAGSVLAANLCWPQIQKLMTVDVGPAPPAQVEAVPGAAPPGRVTTYRRMVEEDRSTNPHQVNQVTTRLNLYTNGLRAWLDRPLLGHGVQKVSGLTGPYEDNEAHNTIIDWLTFAGVLGLIPLVAWGLILAGYALRRQNFLGFGAVAALALFAQFGLYVRHPLFWVLACAFASLPNRLDDAAGPR